MIIKLMSIAGARPNFMKLAAIADAVKTYNERNTALNGCTNIKHIIVHTGQHYDAKMSHSFFDDLGIPKPDVNLEVGSASHAAQVAEIMRRFEPILLKEMPDALLVVGDVNSTIACTLVASKINYPVASKRKRPVIIHVEAGLRSFDRDMPEEINRVLTDSISDMLFVTEQSGVDNLKTEGVSDDKIHFVGNVMIDTLQKQLEKAKQSNIRQQLVLNDKYALVTLHRPSNVDNRNSLQPLFETLNKISQKIKLVFSIHPRTKNNAKKFNIFSLIEASPGIQLTDPLGYLDFLNLIGNASLVITDSGGIQEETTYLGIPCVTLRDNTERPVTVQIGTNYLVGTEASKIDGIVSTILNGEGKKTAIPSYWDGNAGERIINKIVTTVGFYKL